MRIAINRHTLAASIGYSHRADLLVYNIPGRGREEMTAVNWLHYAAYFAAGLILANGIPHFTNGVSGRRFPSPFGRPPGVGKSSPLSNVLWGLMNFAAGYLLVSGVGDFEAGLSVDLLVFASGFSLMATFLAWYFAGRSGP